MSDDDTTSGDDTTIIEDLQALLSNIADAATKHPRLAGTLVRLATTVGETRGVCFNCPSGHMTNEAALSRRVHEAAAIALELAEQAPQSILIEMDSLAVRDLLAALLELVPDEDHGSYPSEVIDQLRRRARALLVGAVN